VLDLGDDADLAPQLGGEPLAQLQHLLEGRHLVGAVVGGVALAQLRDALHGAQGLELGEGEILGEPAGEGDAVDRLGGPPVRELRVVGHVGGPGDLRLVPVDEHAVGGHHQVGLDHVRAHPGGQLVGGQGVLGAVGAGAAVADDQQLVGQRHGRVGGCGCREGRRAGRHEGGGGQGDGGGGCCGGAGDGHDCSSARRARGSRSTGEFPAGARPTPAGRWTPGGAQVTRPSCRCSGRVSPPPLEVP